MNTAAPTRRLSWDEAYRLVVHEGASYADASAATGIPVSTLQKRAASEGWQSQRTTTMSYGSQVELAKARALQKLLDAMEIEATTADDLVKLSSIWRGIESAYPTHRYQPEKVDPKARLAIALELLDELVTYLGEHAPDCLAAMRPHITPFAALLEAA